MKVYLSVDMEGIGGVAAWQQVSNTESDYQRAREWMVQEANAAIEGAIEAGADEIVVNDAHGPMRNMVYDQLHPKAQLISGRLKPLGMMAGIDETFDAALFIGYHTMGGGYGVLAHTWNHNPLGVRINGMPVGEWGINAMIAGHFGVPVAMVTGDDLLASEVKKGLGDVETVVVKHALSKLSAQSLPHGEVRRLIREGAARALGRLDEFRPFRPETPLRLEVDFSRTEQADCAAMMPGAVRLGPLTVSRDAQDALEAFGCFYTFMALSVYPS